MPSRAFTAADVDDSMDYVAMAVVLEGSDESDDDEQLVAAIAAAEPWSRRLVQSIGPEVLSIDRLEREALERGSFDGDVSWNVYSRFGYHLQQLREVIDALAPPAGIRTVGGHVFTGEEGVLLLIRRFKHTDPLQTLTWESGRSISAISEVVSSASPTRQGICFANGAWVRVRARVRG
jgi:hypothetical protein